MATFIKLTLGLLILWRLETELAGAASIVKVAGPEEEKEALRMWAEMCSEGKPGSGEMDGKLVYCAESAGDNVQVEHAIDLDKMIKRKDQVILVQPPANSYNHKISIKDELRGGSTTVFVKPSVNGRLLNADGGSLTGKVASPASTSEKKDDGNQNNGDFGDATPSQKIKVAETDNAGYLPKGDVIVDAAAPTQTEVFEIETPGYLPKADFETATATQNKASEIDTAGYLHLPTGEFGTPTPTQKKASETDTSGNFYKGEFGTATSIQLSVSETDKSGNSYNGELETPTATQRSVSETERVGNNPLPSPSPTALTRTEIHVPVELIGQGDVKDSQMSFSNGQRQRGSYLGNGESPSASYTERSSPDIDSRNRGKALETETAGTNAEPLRLSEPDPTLAFLRYAQKSISQKGEEAGTTNEQELIRTFSQVTESTLTPTSFHASENVQSANPEYPGQEVSSNTENEVVQGTLEERRNIKVKVRGEKRLRRRKNKGRSSAGNARNTGDGVAITATENVAVKPLATYCDFSNPDAIAMSCVHMQMMPSEEMNYEIMHMMRQDLEKLKV